MDLERTLEIPAEVLDIIQKLESADFEAWCVGGAIRDALLDQPSADFDITTSATPDDVTKLFRRTVPIGFEHGTVAVLDGRGKPHEVTTYRRDVRTDGRHAVVQFGVELEEDLARRDFTVNAIAYHPDRGWRDPFAGRKDIDKGVIRAVGDAGQRFREDYLRILRAVRFATRLNFEIDRDTWNAAKENSAGLAALSAERVREEWLKSLARAGRPSEVVELWHELGAIEQWLPELGVDDDRRSIDVFDVLARDDVILATAYLAGGGAEHLLERLRCSRAEIRRGAEIDRLLPAGPPSSDPIEVRRWMSAAGDAVDDLLAIWAATGVASDTIAVVAQIRDSGDAVVIEDLNISGKDLMDLGIGEGPEIGRILRTLLNAVLEEPELNDRPRLISLAKECCE